MASSGNDGEDILGRRELVTKVPIEQQEATIPSSAGYPWAVSQFDYVERDARRNKDFLPEPGLRTWSVEYILSKNVDLVEERGDLDPSAIGSSHLRLQRDTQITSRDDVLGQEFSFRLLLAPDGTLGKIMVPVDADDATRARALARRAVFGLLGVLSCQGNVPLFISREIVRDPESGWVRFWIVLPAPPPTLGPVRLRIFSELRPVYALWRESRNSRSYFYKFLCLFKIVEGLLERVIPDVSKELTEAGRDFQPVRPRVPRDREIAIATPEYVEKRFTRVRDELRGQYRHALAHFELDDESPLDIDDPKTRHEYERLFPVIDYMARTLITHAERLLFLRSEGNNPPVQAKGESPTS
jgi:hypothetical protein